MTELKPLKKVVKTMNYFKHRISNFSTEGINNKIKIGFWF